MKNMHFSNSILRYAVLLICFLPMALYAHGAQGKRIILKGQSITMQQAIQLIEKNSEYTFFYNASDLENNTKRDYNSTGNIEKVLKDVFEGSNVSYVIKGKEVILKVTKTENTQQVKKRTIIGVVTASDIKEPIIGASI